MVIQIEETILIAVAGLVFIPVFLFCIKMIIELGNNKVKMEHMEDHIKKSAHYYDRIEKLDRIISVYEIKLEQHDKDISSLYDRTRRNDNRSPVKKYE
jgi:hypothetical protein